jgi:hypothetical protein
MISSYVGENKEFERQYLTGELEVELTPQVRPRFRARCVAFSRIPMYLLMLGYVGGTLPCGRGWHPGVLHADGARHDHPGLSCDTLSFEVCTPYPSALRVLTVADGWCCD